MTEARGDRGMILLKIRFANLSTSFQVFNIKGGGGVQGNFFWRIRFELWAPQVPLIIGETFGEVLGPRRPTVSEPRPAQKLGVK